MVRNKDKPTDIITSNAMYEYWLETQADRPGLRRDDKYDLKPAGVL
jgi:hypothetical protein